MYIKSVITKNIEKRNKIRVIVSERECEKGFQQKIEGKKVVKLRNH